MKNKFLKLFLCFVIQSVSGFSQITFEHSYPSVQSSCSTKVQLVDMGNDDYKYFYVCYPLNELRIFNMDHSSFFTLVVPVNLMNDGEYEIGYLTKSLFDCDTTMFEYAVLPKVWRNTFYIFRQDGTVLFQQDSTIAPYTIAQASGSYDARPIINTPSGTKLFLAKADVNSFYNTYDIYSLCGSLPQSIGGNQEFNYIQAYPSPSNNSVRFNIDLPSNISEYSFRILNFFGELVQVSTRLNSPFVSFDGSQLPSGIYFFQLLNKSEVIETCKFILTK